MSHSYIAHGIKEQFQDVACNYLCQLQFRLRKYIQISLLKSAQRVLYCNLTQGQRNSTRLSMPVPLVNVLSVKWPKSV